MAEDGEGQPGARLVGVQDVLGVEEMGLDGVQLAVQVEIEAGVVEGAVLDLPVVPGVVDHAVVQGRERFGARSGERVAACRRRDPAEAGRAAYRWAL